MGFELVDISEEDYQNMFPNSKNVSDIFTFLVDYLRRFFPNDKIKEVASLLWDLVGQQIVPTVGINQSLDGLVFALDSEGGRESAMVVIPENWVELVKQNPIKQLGGIVFCASRAKDVFNKNKLDEAVINRAKSYEAEFLLQIKSISPDYQLDKYQNSILDAFPEGLK